MIRPAVPCHLAVADLVSHYLINRINLTVLKRKGRKEYLDTTTAKLSRIMSTTTNCNMATMPEFKSAKEYKHQKQGLSRVELSFLLHHDFPSLHTPVWLISIFYIIFVISFLLQGREEVMRVTRGDFRSIFNPDGTVR